MICNFTFFFPKKSLWVFITAFFSVFQTVVAQAPTVQASGIVVTNFTKTTISISWRSGNGKYRTVFMRKATTPSPTAMPIDNKIYWNNASFGKGRQIGQSGWYCMYEALDPSQNQVTLTDLTPGTMYQVQVFENNFFNDGSYYLKTVNIDNSAAVTTLGDSETLRNLSLSAGALSPAFSPENTDYIANVANGVSSIKVTPVTTDTDATVKVNGTAAVSGSASQEINLAVGVSTAVTIEVTAKNGKVKNYTLNVFRLHPSPTIQAAGLTFTNTTATGTTLNWTNGNGSTRTVFMREALNSDPAPVPDIVDYKESKVFGMGDQLESSGFYTGWYTIVKTNTDNKVEITGLSPEKKYQAIVMEVNGPQDHPTYLATAGTGNPATVNTLSNVATLSNLSTSEGTLEPVFNAATMSYKTTVPDTTTEITVSPVTTNDKATVKVNDVTVASGSASQAIDLKIGENSIAIKVTAQDGTEKTYTVTVTRSALPPPTIQASNIVFTAITATTTTISWKRGNGNFGAVFMRKGTTASPNAMPEDNVDYVPNALFGFGNQISTSGWYCVADAASQNAVVEVTGLTPGTMYQVNVVEYNYGYNSYTYLKTINSDNSAAVTTISNVATLSNLSTSEGTLDPVFDAATMSYKTTVSSATPKITVSPVTTSDKATVKVNNVTVASGSASQAIDLKAGDNSLAVTVTAQDGTTVKTYTINVFRPHPSPTIQVTGLTFTNTTATGTTLNWTNGNGSTRTVFMREAINSDPAPVPDNVDYKESKVFGMGDQIGTTGWYTIVKTNTDSKVEITGLSSGKKYQALVMEFNGDSNYRTYLTTTGTGNPATVTTLSNVATLSNLSLSAGALSAAFSSATTVYTAKVAHDVSSIKVTLVTTDTNATVKVNGTAVVSGSPSQEINLAAGASTAIAIAVTAQDGTAKTYTVTVEKNSLGVVDTKIEGFAVYPNPVRQGKLYIQTRSAVVMEVELFDLSGKKVFSVQTTHKEVPIEGLQKGVYILKVRQDGAESTEKIMVQ